MVTVCVLPDPLVVLAIGGDGRGEGSPRPSRRVAEWFGHTKNPSHRVGGVGEGLAENAQRLRRVASSATGASTAAVKGAGMNAISR
jgi:hypothetical protein